MSSIVLTRPGVKPTTDTTARARLAAAQRALAIEQQRLDGLVQAQERCQQAMWAATTTISEHETLLRELQQTAKADLAWEFVGGEAELKVSPDQRLAHVKNQLESAQSNHQRLRDTNTGLETEITGSERRLRECRSRLHEAMSIVICASPQFTTLLETLPECWKLLRSIRAICDDVYKALGGSMPTNLQNEWQFTETLERDRVGYPVDEALIAAWTNALARLQVDSEAELPG
jgi:hypothetical protein